MVATGWVDPLLATGQPPGSPASKIVLTNAFESRDAPMAIYGKNLTDLSYRDSSLIFYRNLSTGIDKGQVPSQVRQIATAAVIADLPELSSVALNCLRLLPACCQRCCS